jgi:hypothetical protein
MLFPNLPFNPHRIASGRAHTALFHARSREEIEEKGAMECEKPEKPVQKIRIEQTSIAGCFWFVAWLFTIGFLHLHFWKAVFALVIWPYYIGHQLSSLLR